MNINDFKYESKHTEADMAAAKKWLDDCSKEHLFGETANFAFIKGGEVAPHRNQACHASVHYSYLKGATLVATEANLHSGNRKDNSDYRWRFTSKGRRITQGDKPAELMMPFFEWLVYESVFGRFILNRDDRASVEQGFVVSTELPPGIFMSLMILSRHFFEVCVESFELFNKLRSQGIAGSVAYAVAFNTEYGSNTSYGVQKMDNLAIPKWGHRITPLFTSMADFKNFITGKTMLTGGELSMNAEPNLYGTTSLFHPLNQAGKPLFTRELILRDEKFRKALASYRGQDSVQQSIINPFAKPSQRETNDPTNVTYGELFDFVIPYLHAEGAFDEAIH